MALTAEQRQLRARLGGLARAAKYDSVEVTRAAHEANARKWLDQVDPDRSLPAAERDRRATAAKRAHFTRLALMSSRARSVAREDEG